MHLRFGFPFQKGGRLRERGVGLRRHLLLQAYKQPLVQRGRIATTVRQRLKALTGTPESHHSGDRAAAHAERISDLIEGAFAGFIGQYQSLSQVSGIRPHALLNGVNHSINATAKRYRLQMLIDLRYRQPTACAGASLLLIYASIHSLCKFAA
jgi:hypothetical protein